MQIHTVRSLTSEGHITGFKFRLIIKSATLLLSDITGVSPSFPVSDASWVTCQTHAHTYTKTLAQGGQGKERRSWEFGSPLTPGVRTDLITPADAHMPTDTHVCCEHP